MVHAFIVPRRPKSRGCRACSLWRRLHQKEGPDCKSGSAMAWLSSLSNACVGLSPSSMHQCSRVCMVSDNAASKEKSICVRVVFCALAALAQRVQLPCSRSCIQEHAAFIACASQWAAKTGIKPSDCTRISRMGAPSTTAPTNKMYGFAGSIHCTKGASSFLRRRSELLRTSARLSRASALLSSGFFQNQSADSQSLKRRNTIASSNAGLRVLGDVTERPRRTKPHRGRWFDPRPLDKPSVRGLGARHRLWPSPNFEPTKTNL